MILPEILAAADVIASADALVVTAGAGIGVDSGLPDFRGTEGFWKAYPALRAAKLSFAEVASPNTFESDPTMAWGFYGHRLQLYRATVPHEGFNILRRWASTRPMGSRVFTSNVDGHFQKAGFHDAEITECHGSIHHLQCLSGCAPEIWTAEDFQPEIDVSACRLLNAAPRCPTCGGLARPNIMMFGDWGWVSKRTDSQASLGEAWSAKIGQARARVAIIEIGAGTAIPSVRMFGERFVHRLGSQLIRINPREAHVPALVGIGVTMHALEALRAIDACLASR